MPRVLLIVVIIALTVYCTVEVAQAQTYRIRLLPKWMWAVCVVCFPIIGPLAWLAFGRPLPPGKNSSGRDDPLLPPDDDPNFLRNL